MNVERVQLENRQFEGRETFNVAKDDQAICPVCEQTDHSKFFMRKDGYELYECRECQHVFVWPVPTIEELKFVYSFANSYQVQRRVIYDENTIVGAKTREGLKQIENFCARRGRLLDVGCSSGKLLWLAKRNGWVSVCGVELNKDTAQIANENGLNAFVGELAASGYARASCDAIHLGDVIEHVQDPTELLHQASGLLKPDGVMVLVTPNHDAIFPSLTLWLYRLFRMPWSHAAPPFHLNQFTEKSLTKLLEKLNLTAIDQQYRRCNLRYELGETHVFKSFRDALRARHLMLAAGRLVFTSFTAIGYAAVYGIDRCCVWKKKDFEMLLVIRKANC
jgi:2-polyprenyl-3-methyl-5-hydroxy-6-metoxy-1,4-benzoquinol methylase